MSRGHEISQGGARTGREGAYVVFVLILQSTYDQRYTLHGGGLKLNKGLSSNFRANTFVIYVTGF